MFSLNIKQFTEIENQSRIEVLRAASETREAREETREARAERDRVARDLHAATLEAQGWKQEAADAKAAVGPQPLPGCWHVCTDRGWCFIAGTSRTNSMCIVML